MSGAFELHRSQFRKQADWCDRLGSPFNASLLRALAGEIGRSGPLDAFLAGGASNKAPVASDAMALRVAGALHGLVLSGRAPALAAAYPAQAPGWDMNAVRPRALAALEAHGSWVARFMARPPQTNETRRAMALLPGFAALAGPLHLLELGASAGLNQHWDAFGYRAGQWARQGAPGAPVIEAAWTGPAPILPETFDVASRCGCDLSPLDVTQPSDRLALLAYIWPDQIERLERARTAIALAQSRGVDIDKASAADWLEEHLSGALPLGTSVIFHSIAWQYFDAATAARAAAAIYSAGTQATDERRLAWLRFEHDSVFGAERSAHAHTVDLITWPGGARRCVATADPHGRFVSV
ncbi:MAG: DUF2332 domain-containing protein [Pseudomonadota bacterium]